MKRNFALVLWFTYLDYLALSIFFGTATPLILAPDSIFLGLRHLDHGFIFGLVLLILPLGQFLFAPIWGQLSDKYGRKRILSITLLFSALGFVLMAQSITIGTLGTFIVGRILSSMFAANALLGQASIADMSHGAQRTVKFNWQFVIVSLSFITGPYWIQYVTYNVDYSAIYWVIAALYSLTLIVLLFSFTETLPSVLHTPFKFILNLQRVFLLFRANELRRIFIAWFIFQAGWSLFFQYSGEFLYSGRHLSNETINFLFSYVGLGILALQILLVYPLAKKVTPGRIIPWAIAAVGCSLVLGGLLPIGLGFYAALGLYCIGIAFFLANFTTHVSNLAVATDQGQMLSFLSASQGLAQIVVTFIGNFLMSTFLPTPYVIGGALILVSLLFCKVRR